MELTTVLENITPAVVALGHRIEITPDEKPPNFPRIIGTGFVVDERGLIATNRHVAEELRKRPNKERFVAFFRQAPMADGNIHVGVVFRNISMFYTLEKFEHQGRYFGDSNPDLEFMAVDVQGLTALAINGDEGSLKMGTDVVTVGFPSGRDRLSPHMDAIPSQLYPFARRGIISSVLPCPSPNPHGFSVDILSEGGCSGSPICSSIDGRVIGLLYGSYDKEPITYGVPGHILKNGLRSVLEQWEPDTTISALAEVSMRSLGQPETPMEWIKLGRLPIPPK